MLALLVRLSVAPGPRPANPLVLVLLIAFAGGGGGGFGFSRGGGGGAPPGGDTAHAEKEWQHDRHDDLEIVHRLQFRAPARHVIDDGSRTPYRPFPELAANGVCGPGGPRGAPQNHWPGYGQVLGETMTPRD